MSKICIIPPELLPVSMELARKNLRVDGDELDELITTWVHGVTAALEHEIGQCLMPQTWLVTLDRFPPAGGERAGWRQDSIPVSAIDLPHPVLEVESLTYVDQAGAAQVLDPGAYVLRRARYESALVPTIGAAWPAVAAGSEIAVRVRCGYGETSDSTPANVRLYILAKLVEQFDPVTRTERGTVQSAFIERLLDACRSYR